MRRNCNAQGETYKVAVRYKITAKNGREKMVFATKVLFIFMGLVPDTFIV